MAVWIEGGGGTFVKTIGRWADVRRGSLVAWNQKSGGDADAVSGATRTAHTNALTLTWDLKNKQNTVADRADERRLQQRLDRVRSALNDTSLGAILGLKLRAVARVSAV